MESWCEQASQSGSRWCSFSVEAGEQGLIPWARRVSLSLYPGHINKLMAHAIPLETQVEDKTIGTLIYLLSN